MADVKATKVKKEKKEAVAEKTSTAKPVVPKKPRERVKPGRYRLFYLDYLCRKKN